jgi:glucosylceramidase
MNLKQYITTNGLTFQTREVFPSVHMNAAQTVRRTEATVSDDFLGFGVAITGSSCYELSLMMPEQRRALLNDIYGKDGLALSVARLTVGASD